MELLAANVLANEMKRQNGFGNNRISFSQHLRVQSLLAAGELSIRKIAAATGVSKQTILRHKKGIGLAQRFGRDDRKVAPERGSIYKPVADKLVPLNVGDHIDIDWPTDERSTVNLRLALMQRKETMVYRLSFRRQLDGMLRIIRVGTWQSYFAGTEYVNIPCLYPVMIFRKPDPAIAARRAQERLMMLQRRKERAEQSFIHRMRTGPKPIWLGQFVPTQQDYEMLAQVRKKSCSVIGCPFPRNGSEYCYRHAHFFDYQESLEGRGLEFSDTHRTEESPHSLLSTMQAWELERSADRCISDDPASRAREKMSDDWWKANVLDARVAAATYKQEAPVQNIQHTGAFILWKGFGRRKIRKSQRMRAAGWHGNHPEQKPMERFTRETINELPILSPHGREQFIEEVYEDDEDYTPLFDEADHEQA